MPIKQEKQRAPKKVKLEAYTIEGLRKLAIERGGKCLSEEYEGSAKKHLWECSEGHRWEMTPTIVKSGRWCPVCRAHECFEVVSQAARDRGVTCLSDGCTDVMDKLLWRCSKGHQWENTPLNLRGLTKATWCPVCRLEEQTGALEAFAADRKGKYLGARTEDNATVLLWECRAGHRWESSTSQKLYWCPECQLEFDMPRIKAALETSKGRLRGARHVGRRTFLLCECQDGHQWETTVSALNKGQWCPHCAEVKALEDLCAVADARGGKCLSKNYSGQEKKLLWQCAEGHRWEMSPASARKGRWCPECPATSKNKKDREVQALLFAMRLAAKRGGRLLSETFLRTEPMEWECRKGHRWSARIAKIMMGDWCPECDQKKEAGRS